MRRFRIEAQQSVSRGDHHLFGSGVGVADRPRTLREMFVDAEYDNDYLVDDTLRDDGL